MSKYRNKNENPSAAELSYLVMANDPSFETATILSYLVEAGKISLSDEVITKDSKILSLKKAILFLGEPGVYSPAFYTGKTANALLKIDPDFFNENGINEGLWLEDCLVGWAKDSERDRKGFSGSSAFGVDVWAKTILESLSPDQFTKDLFAAVLQLGFKESANFLLDTKPDFWYEKDAKGMPILRSAAREWAWEMGVDKGLDPYHKFDGKTPLWRAILPKSSQVIADKHSIRDGVEAWLDNEISKEGADPSLEDVRRQLTVSVFEHQIHSLNKDKILRIDQWEKYISDLPPCWVNWEVRGVPAWIAPLKRIDAIDTSKWLDMLAKQPLALKSMDEFGKAMLYLLVNESSLKLTKAVKDNHTPAADIDWRCVFDIAGKNPKKIDTSIGIISDRGSATESMLLAKMEMIMLENTTKKALNKSGGVLRL